MNNDVRELYEYIMLQADEQRVWRTDNLRASHVSGISFWMGCNAFEFDMQDQRGNDIKGMFLLMQKWKIRRKLLKLRQRMEREKKIDGLTPAQAYLAKMVEGTLTGGPAKE